MINSEKQAGEVVSDSWYSYGVNQTLRCPVPDCNHMAGIITKAHCGIVHGMSRDEVKKLYGMPYKVGMNMQKRFENLKEGFK